MDFESRTVTLRDGARVTLRAGSLEDVQANLEFARRCVPASPYILTTPEDLWTLEELRERQERAERTGGLILFAEAVDRPGEIVGGLDVVRFRRLKQRHVAALGMMVDAAWRGRGLGRAMLEAAVAWAAAHPEIERLELGVFAQNPGARRLYESCGFVAEGVKPGAARQLSGESLDEVIMARRVKPSAAV